MLLKQSLDVKLTSDVSALVANDEHGRKCKGWADTVVGPNGNMVFGIPCGAKRVMKFNPKDKSWTAIKGGLHEEGKESGILLLWDTGVLAKNNCIYCTPVDSGPDARILKIDTTIESAILLDAKLPEPNEDGTCSRWISGVLALDGCIYFMPHNARSILKIDPKNDAISSVGDDLGNGMWKYSDTILGSDGFIYGIPDFSNRIIKFNPVSFDISTVGKIASMNFNFSSGGVLGQDGCVYALSQSKNSSGHSKVFKINIINGSYFTFICTPLIVISQGFGSPSEGNDGCIYWPPMNARSVLKFDPLTKSISLVGEDFGCNTSEKWRSAAKLSDNGVIYCLPDQADKVLFIDPFRNFATQLKTDVRDHPKVAIVKFLFQLNEFGKTSYQDAIRMYGHAKVLSLINKCFPSKVNFVEDCIHGTHNTSIKVDTFMVVAAYSQKTPSNTSDSASHDGVIIDVLYTLLRRDVGRSPLASGVDEDTVDFERCKEA